MYSIWICSTVSAPALQYLQLQYTTVQYLEVSRTTDLYWVSMQSLSFSYQVGRLCSSVVTRAASGQAWPGGGAMGWPSHLAPGTWRAGWSCPTSRSLCTFRHVHMLNRLGFPIKERYKQAWIYYPVNWFLPILAKRQRSNFYPSISTISVNALTFTPRYWRYASTR